jgi:uncharacterized damage-inducible protein DinB
LRNADFSQAYCFKDFTTWSMASGGTVITRIEQLVETYLDGIRQLRQAVRGMSLEQVRAKPVAGRWSTLEVVCHLADFDAIDAHRMKRTIAEDFPTIFDCDEQLFAATLAYTQRNLEEEVALMDLTRRQMAHILTSLPESALARRCTYVVGHASQERTLEWHLTRAIDHITHHTPFIMEKRRALGLGEPLVTGTRR